MIFVKVIRDFPWEIGKQGMIKRKRVVIKEQLKKGCGQGAHGSAPGTAGQQAATHRGLGRKHSEV